MRRGLPETALKDFGGRTPIQRTAFFRDLEPMSQPRESFTDDQLVRYVLGCLSEEETERLDELSIIDDEIAARVKLVEDDLIDAYAADTLSDERRQRFESFYLATPRRRRKAAFARSFLAKINRPESRLSAVPQPAVVPRPVVHRRPFPWAHAAAAVLLVGISVLSLQHVSLRRELEVARQEVSAATDRSRAVSAELDAQRKAVATATQALADARAVRPVSTIALVLQPQTRGVGPTPIISVAAGSKIVPIDLEVEAAGAATYEVAVKDPTTNRVIWRSTPVPPNRDRLAPVVSIGLPGTLLKAQHYALDLFALRPGAASDFVATYAFEVARQ